MSQGEWFMECTVLIQNRLGLHARAAAKLVDLAKRFSSDITLKKDQCQVDAKSIISVLMLSANKGSQVNLQADGQDEKEALAALVNLIENRFDEGE